ncbi:hypothetical protein J2X31_001704 [Flavobacterium arsenatis]|uniref:Uncharacterized protein n=1 Tax=Flavobacterium arsenatis TaxID=1484332 RepID=A0ABU1TPF7_9FLAO|nr:hypothetical protein [Flavobacterium arsenatis]MDR6967692.1 hypothetical protein [Flavobacterium arsenatis]
MIKYFKTILYVLTALVYLDIVMHPNKSFSFLKINQFMLSLIALVTLISLLSLIVASFTRKLYNVRKIASVLFLLSAAIICNELLFSYSFHQPLVFLIGLTLLAPFPFVLDELIHIEKKKNIYFVVLFSLIVLISTLVFFIVFYVPYEDYLGGLPIMFVHHWIRNWIIAIAIVSIVFGILKIISSRKDVH